MTSFDLSSIDLVADSDRGAWLHLKDPRTGLPIYAEKDKPCRLHLLGPQSKVVQDVTELVGKERQRREAERNECDYTGKVIKRGESTQEELRDDDIRVYTAATTGWENLAFEGDEKFSAKLVAKMYAARPWSGRQVYMFMLDHANFIEGREKS